MVAEMITIHEARPTTSEVSSNVAHQDDELSDEMMKMLKEALDDFDEQQPMKAKTLAKQQSHHDEHHTISEETNLSHEQQMSPPKEAKASAAAIQPKCIRLATTTELDEEMRATAMPAESGPVRVDLQAVELWINHDRDGHSEDGTSTLNRGDGVLALTYDNHATILYAEQGGCCVFDTGNPPHDSTLNKGDDALDLGYDDHAIILNAEQGGCRAFDATVPPPEAVDWGNGVLDLVRDKHVTILNAEQKKQQGLVYCRWQVPGRPPGKRE